MCHYQHGDITSPGPGSEAAPKGAAGGCPGVLGAVWGVAILASGPLSVLPAFFLWDEVGVTAELWKSVTASMLLLRALLAPGHCGCGVSCTAWHSPGKSCLGPMEESHQVCQQDWE